MGECLYESSYNLSYYNKTLRLNDLSTEPVDTLSSSAPHCLLLGPWGSHGVLPGPLPRHVVVLDLVRLINASYLRHQGVVWVGVTQQGADGQENLEQVCNNFISIIRLIEVDY